MNLLLSALFLLSLEEAVLCQHCAGNRCFLLLEASRDFNGARRSCEESGGLFTDFPTELDLKLFHGLSGRFWIGQESLGCSADPPQAVGVQSCSCLSFVAEKGSRDLGPCQHELDGFVCQYKLEDWCSPVQVGAGAQLRYRTATGLDVSDWTMIPLGTIAAEESGAHPAWKSICVDGAWLKAPWNCEVLQGGCAHSCVTVNEIHSCTCEVGHTLHPNNITCAKDPCADCAHGCQQLGGAHVCTCKDGYVLEQDGKDCVDVDECASGHKCTDESEECVNTQGGFACSCKEGFVKENGECVDMSICDKCEHMKCVKVSASGKYQCACRDGFRVSRDDPTKCEIHCTQRDCAANCVPNPELDEKAQHQCFCPEGYIKDVRNDTPICTDINECEHERPCDHRCENLFGGYRCFCRDGFELQDHHACVSAEEDDDGSGSHAAPSPPTGAWPAAVPPYVKTGSALGIGAFVVVCAVLLYFLVRNALKRCGKMQVYSLTRPDMDIFYLQQVTTEKYKKFSFDKQSKSDSQRF